MGYVYWRGRGREKRGEGKGEGKGNKEEKRGRKSEEMRRCNDGGDRIKGK